MLSVPRRLLIVDDEEEVHQGIRELLERDYEITSAMSGEDALILAQRDEFPVVILDLCMGGISGVETLKHLKARNADQQVIILTGYASLQTSMACLNREAFRYLTKPYGFGELPPLVSEGFERYARSRRLRAQRELSLEELQAFGLARREAEVALLIAKNLTNAEIASLLGRNVRTVEKHAQSVFKKLGVSSRLKVASKIYE